MKYITKKKKKHLSDVQILMLMEIAEETLSQKALYEYILQLGWPKGIENFNDDLSYLFNEGLLIERDGLLFLTEEGIKEYEKYSAGIKRVTGVIKKLILPTTAALVTFFVDLFLAILKLVIGFLSGSVALIADGLDGSVDTASAGIVYISTRAKKELVGTILIIAMMFVTGISIFWESVQNVYVFVSQLIFGLQTTLELIDHPYLVILAEIIGFAFAFILSSYQHFVGKRNGSLTLISQSIDSKNHIYVSVAVIMGAIFSIFGIAVVDSIIGIFIAIQILRDGLELSVEVYSSQIMAEEVDLKKYSAIYEKRLDRFKRERFRDWILYFIAEKDTGPLQKDSLIEMLYITFSTPKIPFLRELDISLAGGFDFREGFQSIIQPLLDNDFLKEYEPEQYKVTDKGKRHLVKEIKHMRHLST